MRYYHKDVYMYPQCALHRKAYLGFHVLHLEQELSFGCLQVLFPALVFHLIIHPALGLWYFDTCWVSGWTQLINPYVVVYFNKNTRLLTKKLSNLFNLWAQPRGTAKDSCKVLLFKKFWIMSAEKALSKQMNNWLLSFHIATAFLGSHDSFVNHSCRPNAITLEKWWLFLGGFFCGHSCQDQSCNGLLLWPLLFH